MDMRFADLLPICKLHKIEALQECALEYDEEKSFGTELMYSFIHLIAHNYKHITQIQLSDASYIPCNRPMGDTLDLLTYSIGLYGKTWYELKATAHVRNNRYHKRYYDGVQEYMKPETKASTSYIQLLKMIARGNPSTYAYISDKPEYETMYTSASTFPEFFQNMSKTIPKEKKCQFFKGWLEAFIESYVLILRVWTIDLKDNDTLNTLMGQPVLKCTPVSEKGPLKTIGGKRRKPQRKPTRA